MSGGCFRFVAAARYQRPPSLQPGHDQIGGKLESAAGNCGRVKSLSLRDAHLAQPWVVKQVAGSLPPRADAGKQ